MESIITQNHEKNLLDTIKQRYDGLIEKFAEDFKKLVGFAVKNARNARDFALVLQPLLRKSMVWIDVSKVEAVSVELGRYDEVIVKLKMPSCEVQVTKHGAEVLAPSVYVEHDP